jgi:ribosome-interacting GTPase 1
MPANLTPEYKAAEERYKAARSVEEKIECLELMLATIPKHKGTEKIQADIKTKLAKMRRQPKKKGGGRRQDIAHVPHEGAAQVVVLGMANSGKSMLVGGLTKAEPRVADYPFTTLKPQPAMMVYEDILLQLVDLPALGIDSPAPWVPQVARYADAALVVIDLGAPDPAVQLAEVRKALDERKVVLVPALEPGSEDAPPVRRLPSLVVANRVDEEDARELLALVVEEVGPGWNILPVSARTGEGLEVLGPALYDLLGLVRVYSKLRGKKPEKTPFVLKKGQTVMDFAGQIHKDVVAHFKFARVWGASGYEGQRVSRDYVLEEGDIIEITH